MSDQNSRILPFASLGLPMDPSGSMSMGDDGETVSTTFFDFGARGGTDFQAALDRILAAEDLPGKGFDRYQIVITDGGSARKNVDHLDPNHNGIACESGEPG